MSAAGTVGTVASEVMDWDGAYRGEGVFEGPPPWNIGEPPPETGDGDRLNTGRI